MNRRLVAGAIATVVVLGVTACSGGGPGTAAPTAPSPPSSASATAAATPSATPSTAPSPPSSASATAAATPSTGPSPSAPAPVSATNPANPPRPQPATRTRTQNPVSSPPAPDPNAAYCQTFETIITLGYAFVGASFGLLSTDPAELEQAWQELQSLAEQIAALARQAMGQTDDPALKAFAQAMATQFDHVAAAAAARDMAALESIPEPDLSGMPETPEGYAPCGFLVEP